MLGILLLQLRVSVNIFVFTITRICVGPTHIKVSLIVMCTVQVGRAGTGVFALISQLATKTREDLQPFQHEGRASLPLLGKKKEL